MFEYPKARESRGPEAGKLSSIMASNGNISSTLRADVLKFLIQIWRTLASPQLAYKRYCYFLALSIKSFSFGQAKPTLTF